jgi:hypothetical protein
LSLRVEVVARDGYRVVFALAGLDASLGPTRARPAGSGRSRASK